MLPFLPRLRVGVQVSANLGGVVRFRPLVDTACTYTLFRAEDWEHVFDQSVERVFPGRTSDGRRTDEVKIGGGGSR
jgi:hypothetical protein